MIDSDLTIVSRERVVSLHQDDESGGGGNSVVTLFG